MPRVSIELPSNFLFSVELTVRVSDVNYGGHLGNDAVLTLAQEARLEFYRSLGYKNELSFEGSVGQIIADAMISYKSEAFLGDVLVVKIGIQEFMKFGFDMAYLITNKQTGQEVARVKTAILCFDYATRKIARTPQSLLDKLK
jgi:acyl-CoA thioester hydrolase